MIIYTDKFQFKGFDAHSIFAPIILIRPSRKNDLSIIAHEKKHSKDIWMCGWIIAGLLYLCSKKFRYWFELRGYREELKLAPYRKNLIAQYLSTKYNLKVSHTKAFKDL